MARVTSGRNSLGGTAQGMVAWRLLRLLPANCEEFCYEITSLANGTSASKCCSRRCRILGPAEASQGVPETNIEKDGLARSYRHRCDDGKPGTKIGWTDFAGRDSARSVVRALMMPAINRKPPGWRP